MSIKSINFFLFILGVRLVSSGSYTRHRNRRGVVLRLPMHGHRSELLRRPKLRMRQLQMPRRASFRPLPKRRLAKRLLQV